MDDGTSCGETAVLIDEDSRRSPVPSSPRWRSPICAVALVACGAIAIVFSAPGRSHAPHGNGLGDSLVSLWYKGGSGGVAAMKSSVLGHLWKVEHILVDTELCPAVDREVAQLRKLEWPRPDAGTAPTIGKIMYINLAWDSNRMAYMEEQLKTLSSAALEESGQRIAWQPSMLSTRRLWRMMP